MDQENQQEQLLDYLYGELSVSERYAFQKRLEADPALQRELKSLLLLRDLVQEHLPTYPVPSAALKNLRRCLNLGAGSWKQWFESFWRPAFAGAFLILMSLGLTTLWQRQNTKTSDVVALSERKNFHAELEGFQAYPNQAWVAASGFMARPRLQVPTPVWGHATLQGQPSLVSLGAGTTTNHLSPGVENFGDDIDNLNLEAEQAMAQFLHQQALRLRAMGDFEGAAKQLENLVKSYPFYPYKTQALAQRVDLLFKAGQNDLALQELNILRQLSPALAYGMERRWKNN